jgi:phage shock protein PspC (stress-responsive transcriptional regulator)
MYDKKIGGVCAGFARYFDVDVTFMRILWLAGLVLTGGLLLLVYVAAWLLMPRDEAPPARNEIEQPGHTETGTMRA